MILQIREAVGISDSEAVIMMIAVGHIPDELMVAQSPRKKVNEVLAGLRHFCGLKKPQTYTHQ